MCDLNRDFLLENFELEICLLNSTWFRSILIKGKVENTLKGFGETE
jgi:hypothetical protein